MAARNAAGDTNLALLTYQSQTGPDYGEDYHPTAATQAGLAAQLVTLVQSMKGW